MNLDHQLSWDERRPVRASLTTGWSDRQNIPQIARHFRIRHTRTSSRNHLGVFCLPSPIKAAVVISWVQQN